MGASAFQVFVPKTAEVAASADAFTKAVDDAGYFYGHSGYTGSIAEKETFELLQDEPMTRQQADEAADREIDGDGMNRFDDKWGPAGCIIVQDTDYGDGWLFFGWASS